MKCKECKTKEVYIKKWGLCKSCYTKERNEGSIIVSGHSTYKSTKILHCSEIEFIRNHFTHKNWIYQPCTFHLNGVNYAPDFYDAETNTFIEVVGTKQAFYGNQEKYRKFKELFPALNYEIYGYTGQKVNIDDPHLKLLGIE